MSKPSRPHLAWTAAVVLTVAALSVAAWWLWSRPDSAPEGSPSKGSASQSPPAGSGATDPAAAADAASRAAVQAADLAMEEGRFQAAADALDQAEDSFGWSEALESAAARLSLRETAYREALRPIEFRIESLVVGAEDEDAELFARYTLEGTPVFASELLIPTTVENSADGTHRLSRSHVAVLRTSFALGLTLEIVEPGGIFDSEEVLFGPIPLSPLPDTEGGQLDFPDADSRVRSLSVSYRPSPFEPGVHIDSLPALPPADATAPQLFEGILSAVARDDLKVARTLQSRFESEFPGHKDLGFSAKRIHERAEFLLQNRSTATFTIIELSVDPRPTGKDEVALWASGGEAPAFRASIRTTDDHVLASADDARTTPYLVPGDPRPAPEGNVLRVFARGDAPLVLVVKDSSPRFSSRVVGDIDLPVTLSELPRGSGTIVLERQPRVLIQPESQPNRIRRVVLRWTVSR